MWGITDKSGAARKSPHANTRTPGSLKVASRKRHRGQGVVGKGYADVLKRDATHRVETVADPIPQWVKDEARSRGQTVATFLALAKLNNLFAH